MPIKLSNLLDKNFKPLKQGGKCAYGKYQDYSDICQGKAVTNRGGYPLCQACADKNMKATIDYDKREQDYYDAQRSKKNESFKLSNLLKPLTEAFAGKPLTADDVKKLKVGDEIEFLQKGRNWPRKGKVTEKPDENGSFWSDDEFGFSAHLNPKFDKIWLDEGMINTKLSKLVKEELDGDNADAIMGNVRALQKLAQDLQSHPDREKNLIPRMKQVIHSILDKLE